MIQKSKGNKIADKITSVSKKSSEKSHSEKLHSQNKDELEVPKERYRSLEKKTTNYWWIKIDVIIQ